MKFTWGHAIIVFFVIFFTWIISFVIFTLGENNDLVTKDYYRKGAEYSSKMKIDKRSSIYKDSISIKNSGKGVCIVFASSLVEPSIEKEVYFYRPSSQKDDVKMKVALGDKDLFISDDMLKKGRYIVSISWLLNNNEYIVSKDFVVK